jgi:hypothetical protein
MADKKMAVSTDADSAALFGVPLMTFDNWKRISTVGKKFQEQTLQMTWME